MFDILLPQYNAIGNFGRSARCFLTCLLALGLLATSNSSGMAVSPQQKKPATRAKKKSRDTAVLRGQIAYGKYAAHKIDLVDIEVKLYQQVTLPPVPVPDGFEDATPEKQQEWLEKFEESDQGKQFIEKRKQILDSANVFDIRVEKDGSFILYDVPPGMYGIQGRTDKQIDGTTYAFEVFGELEVKKEVDEIPLAPVEVVVTPLLKYQQDAPSINVKTYDDKDELTLDLYKDKYLFVGFWSTESPDREFQSKVQSMYNDLKEKYPLKLLSICVDENRRDAVNYIIKNKLREGSHGFTGGWEHSTIEAYGVRSIPSLWLIDPQRKIIMTQYEFMQAFQGGKPNLTEIVADRIDGKDVPTPADEKTEEQ